VKKIKAYFKGVISELKKVSWPTRKEAMRLTIVVVGVSIVFAALVGLLDLLFTYAIQKILGT